jgi:hypothetical protein
LPLLARAFLGIWHNLKPGFEREFDRWHTHEHMPERVGVPGFRVARRYMNWKLASHLCFTMYEGAHTETFRSPGYLARLNDPTPWTRKVGAAQTDFLRGAFEVRLSLGAGLGGALGTFRLAIEDAARDQATMALRHACEELMALHGVVGVHLGVASKDVTGVRTKEMDNRPSSGAENAIDTVVLVETFGFEELEAIMGEVAAKLRVPGAGAAQAEPYRLAYLLAS